MALSPTFVTAPMFSDTTTGNLTATAISTSLAWLVELRCITNMVNTNTLGEINQMRADELAALLNQVAI